jgi:DNA-directed RNA polymerase I subunit RPA1
MTTMNGHKTMDTVPAIDHSISGVSFAFYTPEELKKLSVLQITAIEPFDSLGHAVAGGLYDTRLGPCKRFDVCATCRMSEDMCGGHVGHIILPFPVISPVLMQTLETILKFTCLSCLHLKINRFDVAVHLLKIEALDFGLDYLIDDIDEIALQFESDGETDNLLDLRIKRMRKAIYSSVRGKGISSKCSENVRTIVERKKNLLKEFWNRPTGRSGCPRCKGKNRPISLNSRTFSW